jgi:hypothetical protein
MSVGVVTDLSAAALFAGLLQPALVVAVAHLVRARASFLIGGKTS